jgi:hypothetical protein
MESLRGWFSGLSPNMTQPRVESDIIVPVRFFDDTHTLRSIVMAWMFRIDEILAPDKLEAAISQLLTIPSWRHLGGRLRLNVSL